MCSFCIKLAGISFRVNAIYDSTKDFCRDYLTSDEPLFSVTITQDLIDKVKISNTKAAMEEGRRVVDCPDYYIEFLALATSSLGELLRYNVILFHGSVLALNGKAYVFTAKSGTGKTTHSRLWLKLFPDCHILNGDKPLLLFKDNRVYACGSPWQGKEDYGINEILPLESVCILQQDKTNHIERLSFSDAFDTLLTQSNIPEINGALFNVVKLLQNLSSLNIFKLYCNMDDEAAYMSHNAMVK